MADTQPPNRSEARRKRSLAHLYLICLGFVALAVATAMTRRQRPAPAPTPAPAEGQHYLYCPECGLEMTCPPELVKQGMVCPHCGAGKRMRVTGSPRSDDQGPLPASSRWTTPLVFGVPVVAAVAVFLLQRASKRPRGGAAEPAGPAEQSEIACPRCGHRMASGVYGPGSTAICPVCAERIKIPGQESPRKKGYRPEVIREKRSRRRPAPDEGIDRDRDQGPAIT